MIDINNIKTLYTEDVFYKSNPCKHYVNIKYKNGDIKRLMLSYPKIKQIYNDLCKNIDIHIECDDHYKKLNKIDFETMCKISYEKK